MEPESGHVVEDRPGLVAALLRYRWVVLGSALVAGLLGYSLSFFQPKVYSADVRVVLSDPSGTVEFAEGNRLPNPDRYIANQAELIGSLSVASRASERLGGVLSPVAVRASVTATPARTLDLVIINATAGEAALAADIANAVVAAYEEVVAADVQEAAGAAVAELERSRTALQARIDELDERIASGGSTSAVRAERDAALAQLVTLDTRIEQIQVDASLYGSGVQFAELAEVPRVPTSPRPARNGAAAAAVGLVAAAAFAWWRSDRNPVASDRLDPGTLLGAPLLGEIPEYDAVGGHAIIVDEPRSAAGEAYQVVATALTLAMEDAGASSVAMTSAGVGDGKTTSIVNLAAATRLDGRQPLLVDADERARGLSRLSDQAFAQGLTDLAQRDAVDLGDCLVEWQIGDGVTLDLVPAGSRTNPAAFFRSAEFEKAMAHLRAHADLLFLDAPPVPVAAETLDIVSQTDAVVLVVERGTPLRLLAEVRDRLALTHKPVIGYIFNKASRHGPSYGYGKWRKTTYGYGYE